MCLESNPLPEIQLIRENETLGWVHFDWDTAIVYLTGLHTTVSAWLLIQMVDCFHYSTIYVKYNASLPPPFLSTKVKQGMYVVHRPFPNELGT